MVAIEIFEKITKLQQVNYVGVEDFSDRLNFQATVVLLLAFCTTTTFKTYVLSPVSCYLPTALASDTGQEQYVNNYCWTEGTYAVRLSNFTYEAYAENPTHKYKEHKIMYYQWVPFVLGLQAIMFYVPRVFWSFFSYNRAGTDIGHLIRSANDAVQADGEKHSNLVKHVCMRLGQMLQQHQHGVDADGGSTERTILGKISLRINRIKNKLTLTFGNRLILIYFFVKLGYLANSIMQLYLMYYFLGFKSNNFAFGLTIFCNLLKGKDWKDTMIFPRVGCCTVAFKTAYGINHMFAQCTLPINMINEKIYIFLWFWIAGTAICTAFSLPLWVYRIFWVNRRPRFVKKFLRLCDNHEKVDKRDCIRFVRDFLRHDGVFLLKMIALNAGEVVCTEIISNLWSSYVDRHLESRYYSLAKPSESEVTNNDEPVAESESAKLAEDATLLKRRLSQVDSSPQADHRRSFKQQVSMPH